MHTPLLLIAVLVAMGLTTAALLAAVPRLNAMAAESSGRYLSLDALRGLLASFVLVHHAAIARRYFTDGYWVSPASQLYHFLGNGSVAVFFMITGLLFWGKAIDGRLQPVVLLRSRLRRIMPLYLLSLALILLICLARTGFEWHVPIATFIRSMLRWLAGGLLGKAPINGVETILVNAGVTWTLQYEWVFYLSVPLMAWCAPRRRFALLLLGYLTLAIVFDVGDNLKALDTLLVALPFAGGMIAAYIVRDRPHASDVNNAVVTCGVLASVALVVALYVPPTANLLHMALVPAFVAIALGNDLFGVLRLGWLRWLGHISFSVYLLHGIVLLSGLRWLNERWPITQWSDGAYIAICSGIGAVVVLLASLTYLVIERSFIEASPAPARPVPVFI